MPTVCITCAFWLAAGAVMFWQNETMGINTGKNIFANREVQDASIIFVLVNDVKNRRVSYNMSGVALIFYLLNGNF